MTPDEARERQQQVVEAPPNLFVLACPGAGKTRTVVRRFIRVAEANARRAVAVISFTNRAADEISQRCTATGRPEFAQYPHFVGTLDRFIATYIVRPFGDLGGPIRVIDSWDALDIEIAAKGVQRAVSLDHFEVSPDGVLRFDPRPRDPKAEGAALQRLEWNANKRYKALRAEGYITCDDARSYALRLLDDHPQIAQLLQERFVEIIVDEAQDCSTSELALLGRLRNAGLPVVVVCDPNQSIYEWRDADRASFDAFVDGLDTIQLDGNWRSTPAICALSATLREGPADHAVGPHADDDRPIYVVRYGGWVTPALGERFNDLLTAADIASTEAVILGHGAGTAAQAAGAGVASGQGNVATLATSCARLVDPVTEPRERQREFDRLQRLLLRLVRVDAVGHTTERAAELAGVDQEWLRRSALQMAATVGWLDFDMPMTQWLSAARAALADVGASAPRAPTTPGTLLRTPQGSADKSVRQVLKAQTGTLGIRHSSVHRAKGTEEPAVLAVLPRDRASSTRSADLVTAWEQNYDSEAKRVLYVAVTRAQRLCALAVPDGVADRVMTILEAGAVPYDWSQCDGM